MIGHLYFADNGSYIGAENVGTLRSKKKGYQVKPVTQENRDGNPETIAYEVEVRALCLTLDGDFLTDTEWYFRIHFPDDSKYINLGLHPYQIDYDGLINRNGIEYHEIRLAFNIAASVYSSYAVPASSES